MSVNIISLNQIVDLFASFAEQHYFIKDFGYGATSEIGTSRQMMFPYLWLSLDQTSTITIQNKTAIPQYGITILFMDKINIQKNYLDINGVNSDNSQEVLSDTLQLLQDLITEIEVNWGNYGLRIEGDVSCFPGVDETTDKVCGWVGQFNLRVKHSNCITPMGDIVQTNISPINPYTRYLTCDTLSTCQVIQDIQTELSGITGGTGNYVPYTGATESVYLGDNSIIMNNGVTDTEISPSYFAVEISGGSEYSLLEYNQLTMVNNNTSSILSITPSNITFSDGSIQTTAYTGGTGDLQIVTDNGNTTTNDIILIDDAELVFGAGGGILLDNYSRLREGTIDAGTGGSKGIAQICGVGYELKWEAGSLYVMNGNGNIIREVRYTFTNTPTINDDITKGFTIGSRWVLDNGDIYVCSDDTTGAAVWNLQQGNINYYGSFSFSGNQTGNSGVVLTMSADTEDSWNNGVSLSGGTKFMIDNIGVYNIQFSSQMVKNNGNNTTHTHIWLSQNGNDVPNSATQVGFPSNSVYQVPSWNWFFETTTPNEYVEIKWEINSNVNNAVSITSQPISGNVPSIPGNIITINKVG